MLELVRKPFAQERQEQKIERRTAVERIAGFTIGATAVAALAVLVATAVYAQDKYSLKSPSGIAFSDFMEKDSKRFPKSGGWGYAVFDYEAASDKFTADPKSFSDCGHACHTPVKAKDYIFHPYEKR